MTLRRPRSRDKVIPVLLEALPRSSRVLVGGERFPEFLNSFGFQIQRGTPEMNLVRFQDRRLRGGNEDAQQGVPVPGVALSNRSMS
jgi:hypothetical protein